MTSTLYEQNSVLTVEASGKYSYNRDLADVVLFLQNGERRGTLNVSCKLMSRLYPRSTDDWIHIMSFSKYPVWYAKSDSKHYIKTILKFAALARCLPISHVCCSFCMYKLLQAKNWPNYKEEKKLMHASTAPRDSI